MLINSNEIKQLAATFLGTILSLESRFKALKNRYILAYHRVLPAEIAKKFNMQDSMWVSVDTFSDDINWFKCHGDIVDLDTILDFDIQNQRPMFSITFDDGWIDNYEHAFPILKKHNIPATIFLVTNAIETGHLFWVEDFLYKIAQLSNSTPNEIINSSILDCYTKIGTVPPNCRDTKQLAECLAEIFKPLPTKRRESLLSDLYEVLNIEPEPMSGHILKWSEIIEMSRFGINFGSHTHTHEILQYAGDEIIAKELALSKRIITEKLGKSVRYFCYPNARYRDDNADLVAHSGYEYAFRMHNLRLTQDENRYFLPRILLNEKTCRNKNYLLCKLLNFPKF